MTREEISAWLDTWLKGQRYTPGDIRLIGEALVSCPQERADGVMRAILLAREAPGKIPVAVIVRRIRQASSAQHDDKPGIRLNPWHDECPAAFKDAAIRFETGEVDTLVDENGVAYRILCVAATASGPLRWAFRTREVGGGNGPETLIWQDQMAGYVPVKAGTSQHPGRQIPAGQKDGDEIPL